MGKMLRIQPATGRFASIDGLRGYMAFFVFLHHSCMWYLVTHGYGWSPPPSNLFSHFGASSVDIFFMITAFLFFSKLLEVRAGKMDWLKLYVSRALRILPLYLFALFVLVSIVAVLTQFTLREPAGKVLQEILQWMVYIRADINGFHPTWMIIASVIWSLPYEWSFYFSLPLLGLFVKVKSSALVLIFSLAGLFFFIYVILFYFQWAGSLSRMYPFLGGIAAAFLIRVPQVKALASGWMTSVCIIIFLTCAVSWGVRVGDPVILLFLSISFILIACGNDLFGILTHPLSRMLGQISYSIYLLHGIFLFVTFKWIIGIKQAGQLSPLAYWGVIALCGMGVILICSVTYRFIEYPAMQATPMITAKLRKGWAQRLSKEVPAG